MTETKPRINRGNRGQLFRATWLSSARCSETFWKLHCKLTDGSLSNQALKLQLEAAGKMDFFAILL